MLEELHRPRLLGGCGRAAEHAPVGGIDACGVAHRGLHEDARGDVGLLVNEITIEHEQRLRWHVGHVAAGREQAGLGEVKHLQDLRHAAAHNGQVDAAHHAFVLEHPIHMGLAQVGVRHGADHGAFGGFHIKLACDGQDGIADRLGIEAALGGVPERDVVGIDALILRIAGAAELVGVAEHDVADQAFHRPAVLHEAGGEAVEQRLVAGPGAHLAKVVGRGDDARAEKLNPHAVHRHT